MCANVWSLGEDVFIGRSCGLHLVWSDGRQATPQPSWSKTERRTLSNTNAPVRALTKA
ncbi:hypothetical protein PROFUN_12207 [Planoprotostelium fungivorum]|uniref:Uncharacterized protein n=1 Tax=Planoprotostelium fungivorum TaxID=1890364 RepID=A0A2P6N854_9EUKA|nr:hypothetical protein PROFUN_12207 [Planoprotostelium fungivorum]